MGTEPQQNFTISLGRSRDEDDPARGALTALVYGEFQRAA
jgi:hypothetical protein